jgi:metal-responsive CopG/Arc/MetJ family transcriptional regulator
MLITLVHGMTVISVSVPEKLLEHVETAIKEQGFANRSEIVRQALRAFIRESRSLRELEGQVAASITIIYERGAKKAQISEIQHSFGNIINLSSRSHRKRLLRRSYRSKRRSNQDQETGGSIPNQRANQPNQSLYTKNAQRTSAIKKSQPRLSR